MAPWKRSMRRVVSSATDVVTMFSPAQTERAGLLLAQGRVEEAARWAEECGLTDEDDISIRGSATTWC